MKIVLMQPYFFPYIGYFQLINLCNEFIVFDTVQYIKKGWINRNRILHPNGNAVYINVPIKKIHSNTPIKDVKIDHSKDWKSTILNRLTHYYHNAPYREEVLSFVNECFEQEFEYLSELNTHLLRLTCNYLNIDCKITTLSNSEISYKEATSADEWGLNICKALGATTYINAPGGITFFDQKKYTQENIAIQFIQPILNEYNQRQDRFEKGLSILDAMMFNSKEEIHSMLQLYEVINEKEDKVR